MRFERTWRVVTWRGTLLIVGLLLLVAGCGGDDLPKKSQFTSDLVACGLVEKSAHPETAKINPPLEGGPKAQTLTLLRGAYATAESGGDIEASIADAIAAIEEHGLNHPVVAAEASKLGTLCRPLMNPE